MGMVRRQLQISRKEKYDKLGKQIEEAEKALRSAQQREISQESCDEYRKLESVLDDLHRKHEPYWYLRSRLIEVKDGDRNTSYFHHKATQQKKRNQIKGLYDEEGVWQQEEEKLEEIVGSYCEKLFCTDQPSSIHIQEVLQHILGSITPKFDESLLKPYSKDEIHVALLQMHPCKALEPDGMNVVFYQRFWHIVGSDVAQFVSDVFHGLISSNHVNNTNISLISKVKYATKMVEFRPISLSNVLYKLVTMTLVMLLKHILLHVMTENKSAIVPGCLITDNALTTLELFFTMKKRSKRRRVLFL